jgi:hypothetical protein
MAYDWFVHCFVLLLYVWRTILYMDQTTKWIIKKSITKKSQQQSQSHTKLEGINEDKGKKKYNYCVHEDQNSICVFVFVAIMYGLFWGPCGVGPIRRI